MLNEHDTLHNVKTLFPMLQSIDYDGVVQFKSSSGIHVYHISYVNPGEKKKMDEEKLLPLNSLKKMKDSVSVSDMWGTGSLFTQNSFYKEKWIELRFLTPLFEEKDNQIVQWGYACTNWLALRDVSEPKNCLKKGDNKNAKTTEKSLGVVSRVFRKNSLFQRQILG